MVASVLCGNRNFEGRIQQDVRANYLASPPLVVAYALAGSMNVDLTTEPLGTGSDGQPVFLKDIWPTEQEIQQAMLVERHRRGVPPAVRQRVRGRRAVARAAGADRRSLRVGGRLHLHPPAAVPRGPVDDAGAARPTSRGARVLAVLGDSITTDHISPAGNIKADSPAGKYLVAHGVAPKDFNSYGARRGNHEVMMRGTFANTRIKNQLVPGVEGGVTAYLPGGEVMPIYDAAMQYQEAGVPLVVLAGKEYGSGSSRDWAAKGTMLLGVKAVIAESFERIHRSNLVNMGVLPLQFVDGETAGVARPHRPRALRHRGRGRGAEAAVRRHGEGDRGRRLGQGASRRRCRIDTPEELTAFRTAASCRTCCGSW